MLGGTVTGPHCNGFLFPMAVVGVVEVIPPVPSTWFVSPVCSVLACSAGGMRGGGAKTDWAFAPKAKARAQQAAISGLADSLPNRFVILFCVFAFMVSDLVSWGDVQSV